MKLNNFLYLVIGVLLIIVLLQRCGGGEPSVAPTPKIDTVIKYITVHDTVKGKIKYIKGETDTSWITLIEYVPDTNYPNLLKQYKAIGDRHFKTNIYKTKFPIKYGSAQVTDSIFGNELVNSKLELDVVFPENTITIVKPAPPVRRLYIGTFLTGDKKEFINSINIGMLYKDKKDKIFGASVGYNNVGTIQYGISSYWKIK
jgi:hypothetical protein